MSVPEGARPQAILTDIEGTTSSLSFVRDVLFPYARRRLPDFIQRFARDSEVRKWLDGVAAERGGQRSDSELAGELQDWIDRDRKHPALKALQGMIWADGYRSGDFTAHFYRDAVVALRQWNDEGVPIYIYSSGSVFAQRLFFRYSAFGDLTSIISGWFDMETGGKQEVESYRRIQSEIGEPAACILFFSDVVPELDAAREVGMMTVLVDRSLDYVEPRLGAETHGHRRIETFDVLQRSG